MSDRGVFGIGSRIVEANSAGARARGFRSAAIFLAGLLAASFAGAATVVVNDASDTLHSSGCAAFGTGTCTLRDAITFANANAGADVVQFDIAGTGVQTI